MLHPTQMGINAVGFSYYMGMKRHTHRK